MKQVDICLSVLGLIPPSYLFGNHPFQGRWARTGESPEVNELIRGGFWPYAQNSPIQPGPTTVPLYIVHPEIKQCFLQCFNEGYIKPDLRPTATDWFDALQVAIADLRPCTQEENHYYSQTYGKCYWCDRTQQLGVDVFATTPRIAATPASSSSGTRSPTTPSPKRFPKLQSLNSLETMLIAAAIAFGLAFLLRFAESYQSVDEDSQPNWSQPTQNISSRNPTNPNPAYTGSKLRGFTAIDSNKSLSKL